MKRGKASENDKRKESSFMKMANKMVDIRTEPDIAGVIRREAEKQRKAEHDYWTMMKDELLPCEHAHIVDPAARRKIKCMKTGKHCICAHDSLEVMGEVMGPACLVCPGATLRETDTVELWKLNLGTAFDVKE